ncbi:MAG: cell division protein ZapA [Bacteroidetes bacterium]|nr:cell division protein ZapA [Bacteroidota bacterium]
MEAKSIRLRIYGTDYPLKVDDEELTLKAAEQLDRMMHELHTQIPDQPPTTLAVLSALNVSEQLTHEQQEKKQLTRKVEQELRSINQLLDGALNVD